MLYNGRESMAVNASDVDFGQLASENFLYLSRTPKGSLTGKPTELGIKLVNSGKLDSTIAVAVQRNLTSQRGRIFIGHGGAAVWKDLRDFLERRLCLITDEFNREPVAGLSTKEVLERMLADACFAFLVMTGEDAIDGKTRARENVVHEVGLFQGRLGFQRAIVLLEDGCSEFSNIHGLSQIGFPKGNILAVSEDLRRVLERERLLGDDIA